MENQYRDITNWTGMLHQNPILDSEENSKTIVKNEEVDAWYFRELEKQGMLLNEEQIHVVRHGEGPLLALAGPGSGKTTVMTCRAGYLLRVKQINPQKILMITFTKKAAQEMRERVGLLPGLQRSQASLIHIGTFHSVFLKMIRGCGHSEKIIASERYKQIVMKKLLKEKGLHQKYEPETLLEYLSHCKLNNKSLDNSAGETALQVIQTFEKWKKQQHSIDFDDILVKALQELQSNHDLRRRVQNRFEYVMADEFQDTNYLQFELLKVMINTHQNLSVTGDDDQTIYSFNGARNEFILQFDQVFPSAETVKLESNYRSPGQIIHFSNSIIQPNKYRREKKMYASRRRKDNNAEPQFLRAANVEEEAKAVVDEMMLLKNKGEQYRDMSVLYRTASSSRAIFEELTSAGIPFIYYTSQNQLFYEQAAVRPLIDHLRLIIDKYDIKAVEGVLPSIYISREAALSSVLQNTEVHPLLQVANSSNLKPFQVKTVKERLNLLDSIEKMKPATAIKRMRTSFYDVYLDTKDAKASTSYKDSLLEALDELEGSAKRFEDISSFVKFIDSMRETFYQMEELKKNPQTDAVSLMTIHRAKGLEFSYVFFIGLSESILPHSSVIESMKGKSIIDGHITQDKALEEERRIAYVAATRAKECLYLSSPSFYRGRKVGISRFIEDMFTGRHKKQAKSVWYCSSATCNIWQEIDSQNITEKNKTCPLCKEEMLKGERVIR
ncbi:UvrD-helicase domain-containing protein [Alteribacillus sp. HJP-4]|uniref:UvrD-helicase domain-containing protein n=1 Tax=Alteribacillus sp. HJP-4 TaxID=2775394 RepID=UPI0035CD2142